MNNQLSISRAEPNSTNAIAKSSKVLNSVANLHLRTENNHEQSRSPERGPSQLRQTWRRPRMPYNKLPDAFQIKQKKKKSNKELIDNLDRIVKINEYKEIQKLLAPISADKKIEEKPREVIANPLATIHKYFKMESRFREKMKEGDRSSHKLKTFSTKQQTSFRITDCITLQVIKHRHNTGTVKKMLHVPTLKLLCAREEPLSTKDQRLNIKSWLEFWQGNLSQRQRFINLHGYLFNVPEGAISVITDYCENGSLLNLLDSVFTLPQSVIRQIFGPVFEGYEKVHREGDQFTHFGGISPSQILFTAQAKVKIGIGLFYQLSQTKSSLYGLRAQPKSSPFDMNTTQRTFLRQSTNQNTQQIDRSLDVFKLGLMMLECAIGGLQNFQQSILIQEALKNVFTEEGQKMLQKDNVCCLIHSDSFLLQSLGQQDERSRRDRLEISKVTPYLKFLKDRFSMPFMSFLCSCLKLIHSQRPSLQQLLNHSFLRNNVSKDSKTVQVCLKDLLLINSGWNQDLLQSVRQEQGQKFVTHILNVLSDWPKETTLKLLKTEKDKILNIGKYVGMNYMGMGERLYEAMAQLSYPQRDFNTSI